MLNTLSNSLQAIHLTSSSQEEKDMQFVELISVGCSIVEFNGYFTCNLIPALLANNVGGVKEIGLVRAEEG